MTRNKYQNLWKLLAVALVFGSLLINIKNIFTSCQVDAEYQVAMAYRILKGDAMFSQMWEAHQTSAFLLAFFEWIFLKITGSTTGIMVYSNAMGIVCKTVVMFCVYKVLEKYGNRTAAFFALLFGLNAYPKDVVLPDFANMQVWFGLLLMCCLICYYEQKEKKIWLVFGAICLCLQVLSYPSCALLWILCLFLLWRYSSKKIADICIFTGTCGVGAMAYLIYFMRGNPAQFAEYIYHIWSGDETHAIGFSERMAAFGQDLLWLAKDMFYVVLLALAAGCLLLLARLVAGKRGKSLSRNRGLAMYVVCFLICYIGAYLLHLPKEEVGTKYHFFLLYVFVEIFDWMGWDRLSDENKRIFVIGQTVGLGGFLATLLLSDLGLFSAFPYMIPAICVTFLPLARLGYEKEEVGDADGAATVLKQDVVRKSDSFAPALACFLICGVMIFRNFIYVNGWMDIPTNFKEDSIFGLTWTAGYGPLKGIKSRDGAYVADVSYLEWQDLIRDGDRVLILSFPSLPASMYLNKDVEICADSVISTPTYSMRQFEYWEEHPEKYPNVVIIRCFGDTPMMGKYNYVAEWLEKSYHPSYTEDGSYWRYYFLDR